MENTGQKLQITEHRVQVAENRRVKGRLQKTSTKFVHSSVIQTKSKKFKQSQFLKIS